MLTKWNMEFHTGSQTVQSLSANPTSPHDHACTPKHAWACAYVSMPASVDDMRKGMPRMYSIMIASIS